MMFEWYDEIQRDVRLAGRRVTRHATVTVIAITCLALGIGAVVAALAALHPVVLSALPFEDSDELVQVAAYSVNRTSEDQRFFVSYAVIDALDRERQVLEGVAAFYQRDFDVLDGPEPERIPGAETVPGSFDVLGARPLLGRTLQPADVASGSRVVLITEALWARRYGRDPDVLGRTIALGDRPHEIVGVLPGEMRFTSRVEVFAAHQPDDYSESEQRGLGVFLAIGRAPDTAAPTAIQADLDATLRALQEAEPVAFRDFGFDTMPLQSFPRGRLHEAALGLLRVGRPRVATRGRERRQSALGPRSGGAVGERSAHRARGSVSSTRSTGVRGEPRVVALRNRRRAGARRGRPEGPPLSRACEQSPRWTTSACRSPSWSRRSASPCCLRRCFPPLRPRGVTPPWPFSAGLGTDTARGASVGCRTLSLWGR